LYGDHPQHDGEQRHGHKSKNKLFTGSKASVVADADSQIIIGAVVQDVYRQRLKARD